MAIGSLPCVDKAPVCTNQKISTTELVLTHGPLILNSSPLSRILHYRTLPPLLAYHCQNSVSLQSQPVRQSAADTLCTTHSRQNVTGGSGRQLRLTNLRRSLHGGGRAGTPRSRPTPPGRSNTVVPFATPRILIRRGRYKHRKVRIPTRAPLLIWIQPGRGRSNRGTHAIGSRGIVRCHHQRAAHRRPACHPAGGHQTPVMIRACFAALRLPWAEARARKAACLSHRRPHAQRGEQPFEATMLMLSI